MLSQFLFSTLQIDFLSLSVTEIDKKYINVANCICSKTSFILLVRSFMIDD